jgi:N-acetylglutamate synthase-like GNAT family acetyltransferase
MEDRREAAGDSAVKNAVRGRYAAPAPAGSGCGTSAGASAASIEPLGASDLPEVVELLRAVRLDGAGLERPGTRMWGVREGAQLVGCAAYEEGGETVLLRSVAVRPDRRGLGWGEALVRRALDEARDAGASEAVLLTETARAFFAARGWEDAERAYVDRRFPDSEQVRSVCPRSAAAMRRGL